MNARPAVFLLSAVCLAFGSLIVPAHAQERRDKILMPPSSIENPGDEGVRAHTNHVILASSQPQQTSALPAGENPGSLDCVYNIPGFSGGSSPACGTSNTTPNTSGGSGVIAIVDAYDYPNAYNDLTTFSTTFGLPSLNNCTGLALTSKCFQVVYASGAKPSGNCSWNQEAALDVEWAHAMAPNASIVLVEASSSSLSSLLTAVNKATSIAETSINGTVNGMVSMSWGSSEFSFESFYDSYFLGSGIVAYFAAAGDAGGKTLWPGVSPNVVSAGGTRVNRDSSGNFTAESPWQEEQCNGGSCGGGGGPSRYERRPIYQNGVSTVVGSSRGTPDLSFDADPYTGVAVYDSVSCGGSVGWMVFGGTSVAAPSLAGIVNFAHEMNGTTRDGTGGNSFAEQTLMYNNRNYTSTTFNDITIGYTGSSSTYPAKTGYDMATGIGSDRGLVDK
jgi:subtilase family serine protease